MIDVHCHMQFHKFEEDYDAVIKDAFANGVTKIFNVGTSLESSMKAVELADKYEDLYAIVGVHPHHADKLSPLPNPLPKWERETKNANEELYRAPSPLRGEGWGEGEEGWIKQLEQLTKHPKVLGIGEIGMDYYSYQSNGIVDPKLQRDAFEAQIELAHRAGLPLQIHNRHAGKDIIEILKHHKNILQTVPGMFHCFAGDIDTLKSALQMGFYIGFDGNSTYKGLAPGETVELKDLVTYTPLDRIVVETDSPYLTPIPHRGKRNEPKYVIITAKFIAELKGVSFEELVEQTDENVYNIFRKLKATPSVIPA